MRFFEKEEGYAPRCSHMKPGTDHGIWSTSGCRVTHNGKRDILDYVECECNRLGTFAVIMTMGKEPKPFLEAAAVPILTVSCILSLLFVTISLFAVCIARLTSDFYVVLAQAILSFAFFPTLVAVDALSNIYDIKDEGLLRRLWLGDTVCSPCVPDWSVTYASRSEQATLLVYCHPYRMLAELVKLFWGPEEEILS
ncbi:uncharacterized protein [Ptychodera flava]|uniref:uncharacterized protein n=1 Tax=Ptychodera flava TaxID=63121 RepID=UPI003969E2C2